MTKQTGSDAGFTPPGRATRGLLAAVLAVVAVVVVAVHELAPELILAIRSKVGWAKAKVEVTEPAASLAEVPTVTDETEPVGPALARPERPRIRTRHDTRAKPRSAGRKPASP